MSNYYSWPAPHFLQQTDQPPQALAAAPLSNPANQMLSAANSVLTDVVNMTSRGRVSKPARRRKRVSSRTPTTVLSTDTRNFRAMVQQFTGGPLADHDHPIVNSSSTTNPGSLMFSNYSDAPPLPPSTILSSGGRSEYYYDQLLMQQQQQQLSQENQRRPDHYQMF
ncbi:uncharacterized protein LOC124937457 [Impatiens glandulifera]|uniref:uncharacterized protein LOC124937457 n=1 Tax=Impatiens glandulifera TaxID=253017 RepID=UPI001FB12964|nr:uncharacterized protein LOC124937457 [Impatiens glandulifera]